MSRLDDHVIKYVQSGTWQNTAKIDGDGNLVVEWDKTEILDLDETSAWCDTCGRPISSQQDYLDHGLSEDWQAL